MTYKITAPRRLSATISLPASKSISNRALIVHALANSKVPLSNLSDCDDTFVTRRALSEMTPVIDIMAAGTAMRFLTAYLAVRGKEHVVKGTERMCRRPIGLLVDALRYLGADILYEGEEGFPPLRVKGCELEGGYLEIPGDVSSQYISALLLIGPVLKNGLTLRMTGGIVSRPYIDLTLWVMREFGAEADWSDNDVVKIAPKPYRSRPYLIESDWSAASYWYEMMALTRDGESRVQLGDLLDGSKQGDSATRYLFSLLGVRTTFDQRGCPTPTTMTLKRSMNCLSRMDFNFVNSPDLAQTLVVTCALMNIPFRFSGLQSLRIKETDRIEALKRELRKLGYVLTDVGDGELRWDGERCEPTGEAIDTYQDHRMAMAFAPAAMVLPSISINDPGVVSKSYPHFWDDLRLAGFQIEEVG